MPTRRYELRQKLLAMGDDYVIRNDAGETVYLVDGAFFSWGNRLSVQRACGTEVATIKQERLRLGPCYTLRCAGVQLATVEQRSFNLFRDRFIVDVPGPDDLEVEGDLASHEYVFRRHGETVATVSKRYFSLQDTYGIEMLRAEDDVLILSAAVVIDLVSHNG